MGPLSCGSSSDDANTNDGAGNGTTSDGGAVIVGDGGMTGGGTTGGGTTGGGTISGDGGLDGGAGDGGTQSSIGKATLNQAQVLGVVATGNSGEVDDGLLTIARALNRPAVQAFGRRMVTDHSTNQEQLGSLLRQLRSTVQDSSVSKQLRSQSEDVDDRLSKVTASDYAVAYIDAAIQDHQEDLKRIDRQLLPNAVDSRVTQFLRALRTTIAAHLQLAQQLQAQLNGQTDGGVSDAGQEDASASDAGGGDGGTDGSSTGTDGNSANTLSDAQIAQAFATANAGEGEQATLAVAHSSNSSVLTFARMLLADHTAAQVSLAGVLQSQHITTEDSKVSDQLRKSSGKIVDKLARSSAANFDKAFASAQLTVHSRVLHLLDTQLIPNATNPTLRATLTTARATVARHLQMARQLVDTLRSQASDAGADGGNDGGSDASTTGAIINTMLR